MRRAFDVRTAAAFLGVAGFFYAASPAAFAQDGAADIVAVASVNTVRPHASLGYRAPAP